MDRKEFIKLSSLFGISIPFSSVLANQFIKKKPKKIIVIGAGAAGLSCGYFLKQLGIKFEILEASTKHGGRMEKMDDFADFPIPLGAEWIHSRKDVFSKIVNDSSQTVKVATKAYEEDANYLYITKSSKNEGRSRDKDLKFINSTWFDFFEEYITPKVKEHIIFNSPVKWIDYSQDEIIVKTDKQNYYGDKVIVTAPVKILQDDTINFLPKLPEEKATAIKEVKVWDGFKAFIEFSEKFYHTAIEYKITPHIDGQKLYYDASYGQRSDRNILGLFSVGKPALELGNLSDKNALKQMLQELDELYDGKATASYVRHRTKNWNKEPYIRGAYVYDRENWNKVRKLGRPVSNKLYFAGGAYTDGENWECVHLAALSAKNTIESILTEHN